MLNLKYIVFCSSSKSSTMSNLVFVVQCSSLYSTVVMQQSLDLSAVSLLGMDEGACKIFVLYSVELMKFVAGLDDPIPADRLIYVISRHLICLGALKIFISVIYLCYSCYLC